jgi:hypothetical protein
MKYKIYVSVYDSPYADLKNVLKSKGPWRAHLRMFFITNNWELIQARMILAKDPEHTYGYFPVSMSWGEICALNPSSKYFKPPEDL